MMAQGSRLKPTPSIVFVILTWVVISLMFGIWLQDTTVEGFFLLLVLVILWALRHRFAYCGMTIFVDCAIVVGAYIFDIGIVVEVGFALVLLQGLFLGFYPLILMLMYLPMSLSLGFYYIVPAAIIGLLLNFWQKEWRIRLDQRDMFAKKNQHLELLQQELTVALAQVEQMSILAERARISGDIHDNAGHELVAAFISLQTVRKIFEKNPEKALELFDKSMDRLNAGVGKMRDAVHNMSTVSQPGVAKLEEICKQFRDDINFLATGDMTPITANMWHVLESVLRESITNSSKHANATFVNVTLDSTKYLVRLLVENDGVLNNNTPHGNGLRNLQNRVITVGGTLSVDKQHTFKVVCVIPLHRVETG